MRGEWEGSAEGERQMDGGGEEAGKEGATRSSKQRQRRQEAEESTERARTEEDEHHTGRKFMMVARSRGFEPQRGKTLRPLSVRPAFKTTRESSAVAELNRPSLSSPGRGPSSISRFIALRGEAQNVALL